MDSGRIGMKKEEWTSIDEAMVSIKMDQQMEPEYILVNVDGRMDDQKIMYFAMKMEKWTANILWNIQWN